MLSPLRLARIPAEDEAMRPKIREFLDREWQDAPAGMRALLDGI